MINNNFNRLLGEKSNRAHRRITLVEVAQAVGATPKTITQWSNNKVTRFDADLLESLCRYFECGLCDLLTISNSPTDSLTFKQQSADQAYKSIFNPDLGANNP